MSGTSVFHEHELPAAPTAPPEPARGPVRWGQLLLPALTLLLAGMSVMVAVRLIGMTPASRDAFLSQNALGPSARMSVVTWLLAGGLLPLAVAGAALVLKGRRALPVIERAAQIVAPATLACFLPALFSVKLSHKNQLLYLLVLGAFGLVAYPLLRRSYAALEASPAVQLPGALVRTLRRLGRPSPRVFYFCLVLLASVAYSAYFGYFTILNHHRFQTAAFDLGIHDNLMFNAMHGHPFRVPVLFPAGGNNLASHAVFAVIWYAPLYALHPGPEMLLLSEAMFIGFAAVPLYLFAATQLSRPMAAVVAIAFLFFPPLESPNFYDFQWLMITPFFHFWLFYAVATRREWLTVIMMVMLYSLREDVAIDLLGLGLFLTLTGVRPSLGLKMTIISAVWFAIDRGVIMPLAGSWYFQNHYAGLFADGESSFGGVIKTILTNPLFFLTSLMSQNKLQYVLHMLVPLAFLPVRRLSFLLLLLSAMFFTIWTTGESPMTTISFQYTAHWTPFLFLAAVLALVVIGREPLGRVGQRAALTTVAIVMLADSYCFGAVLQHETFVGGFSKIEFKITPAERRRYADLKALVAMIPPDASVAATENEVPHISTRRDALPLRVKPPTPVDYLLIRRSHIGDLSRAALNGAMADPKEYGLLAQRDYELFLFKRGHVSPDTAMARSMLGLP
ncbi:MAG TPA: DUF2079 domain-containing protein [Polyangia bacterium]